jgi:hypothetical protein
MLHLQTIAPWVVIQPYCRHRQQDWSMTTLWCYQRLQGESYAYRVGD